MKLPWLQHTMVPSLLTSGRAEKVLRFLRRHYVRLPITVLIFTRGCLRVLRILVIFHDGRPIDSENSEGAVVLPSIVCKQLHLSEKIGKPNSNKIGFILHWKILSPKYYWMFWFLLFNKSSPEKKGLKCPRRVRFTKFYIVQSYLFYTDSAIIPLTLIVLLDNK